MTTATILIEQENLLLQQRLTPAANDWHINNRPNGLLLPDGDRLNQLEKILALPDNWLNQREIEFVQKSIESRESKNARQRLPQEVDKLENWLTIRSLEALIGAIKLIGENLEKLPDELLASVQGLLQKAMTTSRVATILQRNQENTTSLCPDDRYFVRPYKDNTLTLWNWQGKQIRTFSIHQGSQGSVVLSPDGQIIASHSSDSTIRLWDLNGKQIGKTFQGHKYGVTDLAFRPDSKTIASGNVDKTIRLWDLQGNQIMN